MAKSGTINSKTIKSQAEAPEKEQNKSEKRSRSFSKCHKLNFAETFSSMAKKRSPIGGKAESRSPPSQPPSRETSPTGRGVGKYHQPLNKTARVRSISRTPNSEIGGKNELRGPSISKGYDGDKENARSASIPPQISKEFKGSEECYSALGEEELLEALESTVKEFENSGEQKISDAIIESFTEITCIFVSKLEKVEKDKRYLMVKLAIEQQCSQHLATIIQKLLPEAELCKTEPSIIRKSNVEREQMSGCLNKEAQNYFEQFVADSMADNFELPTTEVNDNDKKTELQPAGDSELSAAEGNENVDKPEIKPTRDSLPQTQLINKASCIDHIQLPGQSSAWMSDSELSSAEVNGNVERPEMQPAGNSLPENHSDKLDQGLPFITTEDKDRPSGGIGSFLWDLCVIIVLLTI